MTNFMRKSNVDLGKMYTILVRREHEEVSFDGIGRESKSIMELSYVYIYGCEKTFLEDKKRFEEDRTEEGIVALKGGSIDLETCRNGYIQGSIAFVTKLT